MRFALLVFYAAGTLAVPVPDERIPKAVVTNIECTSPFQPGQTTTYQYAGETINQVEGTTKSQTGLQLTTTVSITAFDNCQFLMRLSETKISSKAMNEEDFTEVADSESFRQSLESYNLLFRMKGKQIDPYGPDKRETTEALNIKRGILSTFQLDEKATVETDINGECKTSVTMNENVAVKTKSLNECSKRARSEIGIQSASIKTDMDLKPLDSKSVCKYTFDDGEMKSVDCKETHMFRPFSAGYETPAGAMTVVNQRVVLVETTKATVEFEKGHHHDDSPFVYQHIREDEIESKPNQELSPVDDVMNKLISKSQLSATETSAKEFTELVMLLRKMDEKRMKSIWDKYFDCVTSKVCGPDDTNMKDLYRQYMLDAIAYCGTPSCVSVVKDVTVSGEVSGERANTFLMSIAFVAKTTDGMIRDILDIAQYKPSRQVFLTLGTLISRHCANSPGSCQSGPVVDAENFLVRKLGKCVGQESHERVEEIIMTLKAMGNAKRPESARNDLLRCALDTTHSNITMSAFNAIRGMPCDEVTLGDLNRIIADHSVDEEKRIYAFQASMNCPTKLNLGELVRIYNSVDSRNSQLASFIWTHLTNLNESSNPANKEAKEILAAVTMETPLKQTNLPIYSHSRNIEKSLYVDYLKSGVSAKANLVFNPENILPKTAMFDMTAKVMGVPVDLVETVVGIDGVESLLDNIAVPEVFAFDVFKTNLAEKLQEMKEKKEVVDRIRRKTNAEIVKPKQFSGFMSMKVMGQELRVMSYDDIHAMIEEIDNMNVIQLLSKIAKGGEKTFSKSMMFLEMTYTVPTGVGLPLKLKLTGTTVGSMELKGKLDMRNMFWGPGALYVNGHVKPTAVVDITGKMGIESKYVSTGLLVSSNMMVSNMLKGSIQYKAGQILKINVDTPAEPVQIFKSSSTPYMYMNGKAEMIEGVDRMIKTDKCMKSQIIGYGLCTSVRVPVAFRNYQAPYFPLSGPAHLGFSLVRGDDKLTTFEFLMQMTKQANGLDGIIEFSTPGAAYERRLSGKMSYTDIDSKKVLKLSTEPFGKVGSVEVSYDGVSRSASIQAKNNFFTSKDIVATVSIQNQTNAISTQYGVVASLQHDTYKFEHVAKYVKKSTGHKLLSKTTYAAHKIVSASLEYNREQKKVIATAEATHFNQAVEVSAALGATTDGEGVIVTATHVPTKKAAILFGGVKNEDEKKEITFSFSVGNKTVKNTLGWYKKGDLYSVEDVFSYDKKTAKVAAVVDNKKDEKSVKISADILGKTAMSRVVYSAEGSSKFVRVQVEALGKTASFDGVLDNKVGMKSLVFNANVLGKKGKSALIYSSVNTTKTVEVSVEALDKSAKLQAVLDNKPEDKSLTFNADVLGKKASSSVRYTTEDKAAKQTLKFSGEVMGKTATTLVVITNVYDQKSVKMVVDVAGKTADAKVGFYRQEEAILVSVVGSAAGKKAGLFWRLDNMNGYESEFGFYFNKHMGFARTTYYQSTEKVEACSSVHYGPDRGAKYILRSCVEFNNLSKNKTTHLQGKVNFEFPVFKRKLELVSDLTKEAGHASIQSKATYNEKVLGKTEVDVVYRDASNSAVTLSATAGKYDVTGKVYTQQVNAATELRFDVSSMGKSLQFVNKYEKAGGLVRVTSNVMLNGKTLPASTLVSVQSGTGVTGSTLSVTLGEYGLVYKSNVMYLEKFGWSSEILALKGEKIITSVFHKVFAKITEAEKEVNQKVGFSLMEKLYKYGWSLGYSKQTVVAKIQYATERTATVTVAFSNDAKMTKVNMIIEYIPSKMVTNSISYDKENKQMDISVEFLPKMFAKFMARLESKDGYQLITKAHLQWQHFDSAVTVINSYVNTEDKVVLSTKVSDNTFIALTYSKGLPKALTLDVSVLGKNATLSASYIDKVITLQLDVNGKTIFKIQGDYNKILNMVSAKKDQITAHFKEGYEKVMEDMKDVIARMKEWASFKINTKGDITTFSVKMFGQNLKKLVFNKEKRTLSIQYMSKAAISIAHLPKTKAISITFKGRRSSGTVILRADWEEKIMSALLLVNKVNVAGIKIYSDKLGMNFKLIATPEFILNTIFSKTDSSLKMEINRISNKVVINEATLEYVLKGKSCNFIFKWNNETFNKATEQVRGLAQPIAAKLKSLLHKLLDGYASSYGKIKELSIEAKAEILKLMNKLDKAFDDIDFIAVRDKAAAMTLNALKKTSTVTYNALIKLSSAIDGLKERIPGDIQKIKDMIKKIKPEIVFAKAKALIAKVKVLIAKGEQLLKKYKIDVVEKLEEVKVIVTKVVKNFTDASAPVLSKAVTLIKDFKIRGKRMEDIVKEATTQSKEYIKIYTEKANATLNKLKVQLHETAKKVTTYVLKMNVPYTNKTVEQVVELIKVKLTELKEKVKSLDVKKLIADVKAKIMDYKVQGKTVKEHIDILKKKVSEIKSQIMAVAGKYKDLPEKTRKALHKLVALCRKYIKNVDLYVKAFAAQADKVAEFAKPLTNYLNIVKASIKKHYGPLYIEVHDAIVKELQKIKLPAIRPIIEAKLQKVSAFASPILKPLVPLYRNLKDQVKAIKVEGMEIGPIVENQIEKFDKAVEGLVKQAKDKLNEEMKMLTKMVATLKSATADQMIDKSIDSSLKIVKEIIVYLNTIYSEKKELTTKYLKDIKEIYEKVKAHLEKVTARPLTVVAEEIIDIALNKTISSAAEMSGLIKQIANLDIANPSWTAWKEADLINHLEKFGVNQKLRDIIVYAKDANITQIILDIVNKIETVVLATSHNTITKVLEDYKMVHAKLVKVIEYVKSISKKDYDAWIAELKTFTTTTEEKLVQWVKDMYANSEKRATDALEKIKELAKTDMAVANGYIAVVQKWYNVIVLKGKLVYSDIKQPTIDVYTHYSSIVSTLVKEQYEIIKTKITAEYKKLYEQLKTKVAELKAKLPELKEELIAKATEMKVKIEKVYGHLMTVYGNMTWEEIVSKLEKLSVEEYEKVKAIIAAKYGLVSEKAIELKQKTTELYKKAIEEYKKIVALVKAKYTQLKGDIEAKYTQLKAELMAKYKELKPKVFEALKKYDAITTEEMKKLVVKMESVYSAAKAKVTEIYGQNKNKTLKQIYLEIKEFIVKSYLEQKKIIKSIVTKNVDIAKLKATAMYNNIETSMKNTVIPEVKQELESIFNQTLRNTVIMSNEIIHAYTPYAVLAKDAASKAIAATKAEIPVVVAKVKGLLKMDVAKLQVAIKETVAKIEKKLNDLKETIKKDKAYEKLVALVEEKIEKLKENPTFIKIKKEVEAIIAKVEKFVTEQVEELKKNPSVIKIEGKLVEAKKVLKVKLAVKIAELKKYVTEKIEELKKNPTYLKMMVKAEEKIAQLKNLTAWCKNQVEKIRNSQEVAKVIETLKQLKISGKFTAEKLQEHLKPYLDSAMKSTEDELAALRKLSVEFSNAPEEVFWLTYAGCKDSLIDAYNNARATSLKQVVDMTEKRIDEVVAFTTSLYETCTDEWTKKTVADAGKGINTLVAKLKTECQKMKTELPALMKKHYNEAVVALKAFVHKHFSKVEELAKKQIVLLKKYWETSPLKAFVDTPVLGELIAEIKNHELVALAVEIKDMSVAQIVVVKDIFVNTCKWQKIVLEEQYAALKVKAEEKYSELKTNTIELYNKFASLVQKTVTIIEETKISDMVAFVEKQYGEVLKKFQTLKAHYMEKVKALYGKYEEKMMEIYGKLNAKLVAYKEKMTEMYKKVSLKVKEMYSKYRPIVEEEYKKMVSKMTVKYNELKVKALAKYNEVAAKAKELYNKYRTMIVEQYETLLKKWNESVVRGKLIAFSKMTIKETIEMLENVPADVKKYITAKYGKIIEKVNEMYKELSEKLQAEKEKIMKKLQPYLANVNEAYKWVEHEVKETVEFVYKYYGLLEKYNTIKAYVVREMKQVAEQVKAAVGKYKKMLSLLPDKLKKSAEEYKIALKKFAAEYKAALVKKVNECISKCKTQVESMAKDALHLAKVSADKSLRALHASLKNLETIEPALKNLITDIRANIKVTQSDGMVMLSIYHAEIVPSFSHQLNNIKALPGKVITVLKVQGKELAEKAIVKLNELKKELAVKVEALKISIKKYAQMIKEKAPVMAAKVKADMKKYAEIVKAKASEMIVKAKATISKVKTDVAMVAEVMDNMMGKLEKKFVDLKASISKNPKFKKLVAYIEMKLNELREILKEEIAKGQKVALKTIETLKVKGTELVEKLKAKAVVLKVTIEKYVEVIKAEATTKAAQIKVIVTEYVKIIKEKAGVVISNVKVVIKKYVKVIKEKAPVVVAKVNDAVKTVVTKVKMETEKVKKIIAEAAAKIEMNLKELKATITKDERYIKLAAFVEKMLKELKKVINEKIAQGEEIAQKAMVKGKELMTQIEAKLNVLKISIIKRVKIVKEQVPVMVAKAKATIKEVVAKLEAGLKELKATITSNEKYIKFVAFVEKKIAELKTYVEELKKNPTVLKMKDSLKAAEGLIKMKYEEMKKEIPVMVAKIENEIKTTLNKSQAFIKANIPKIEKKLKELIATIKNNEMYIFLDKKITKMVKIVKAKIEELKTNPTILKMKSKGIAMLKNAGESLKKDIAVLKKEIPLMVAHAKDIFNAKYNKSVEYIKSTIAKLQVKFNSLKETVMSSEEYIALTQKLNQLKKFLKEKVEELKNNPVVIKYKTKLIAMIDNLLKQINENTVELRHDIMTCYHANANVTLYLYNNAKTAATQYYKKGMEMCSTLKKDALVYAEKVKTVSRETYVKVVKLYNEIAKLSLNEVCKKTVDYGKVMYASLKEQCITTYGKTEKVIKDTIVVLKQKGLNIEKELKAYYEALKNAYEKVKSGTPVKEVLRSLFTQIFGKFDMKSLDIRSTICKQDPALCELIKESWNVHQSLLKKYAHKIVKQN